MNKDKSLAPVLFIPHGGGPLPLLGEPGHAKLAEFLRDIRRSYSRPEAIVVVSAHWEEQQVSVMAAPEPGMLFDYYGFPPESYEYLYPAPGHTQLAHEIVDLANRAGFAAKLDHERDFDHGVFVPMMLMHPEADIPCLQVSLLDSLDPARHMELGRALAELRKRNVLILGSGLSFHNMSVLRHGEDSQDVTEHGFTDWLITTCTDPGLSAQQLDQQLIDWQSAPDARFCHPREEHLLPLHVCAGAGSVETEAAEVVFDDNIMGRRAVGLMWQ